MKKFSLVILVLLSLLSCQKAKESQEKKLLSVDNIQMKGELETRALRNFDRLEEEIYYPENVFPKKHQHKSVGWPGDKEGRVILALVLQAKATHRTPKYLDELIEMYPTKANSGGYFGPLVSDTIFEQQLSGNGWLLRALCEYYIWKKDEKVKTYIQNIINNLALPTKGYHKTYPIDPEERRKEIGHMSGTSQNIIGNWLLSSDIGCDLIFLDGVVQAYGLFPSEATKELIDEIIDRFFEMDLLTIKAQTHATLTGTRALIRYYDITGEEIYLHKAIEIYDLYRQYGMSENYENLNWFQRPTWSEPCAIVDAFMVSAQLWQITQEAQYLNDSHLMYYNAISHTQRANGGFGCDNCPHAHDVQHLKVHATEAWWCCTMRGGEGLASAIEYSHFIKADTLHFPFYHNSVSEVSGVELTQTTEYPYYGKVTINAKSLTDQAFTLPIRLFVPQWAKNFKVKMNGKEVNSEIINGFFPITIKGKSVQLNVSFEMTPEYRSNINKMYAEPSSYSFIYGPLLLGVDGKDTFAFSKKPLIERIAKDEWVIKEEGQEIVLTPVYHLMEPKVTKESGYSKQVLF